MHTPCLRGQTSSTNRSKEMRPGTAPPVPASSSTPVCPSLAESLQIRYLNPNQVCTLSFNNFHPPIPLRRIVAIYGHAKSPHALPHL